MRKKNQGFTLTEILTVIVVLAMIVLVASPAILNIIEYVNKGSFRKSAEGLLKAGKLYHMNSQVFSTSNTVVFYCNSETNQCVAKDNDNNPLLDKTGRPILLDLNGKVHNGQITIDDSGNISFKITNNLFCAYKHANSSEIIVIDGNCDKIEIVHDIE